MYEQWQAYRLDPTLGPMVAQHNQQTKVLEILKSDLRTSENIDAIITLSERQLRLENRIWDLVGGRPEPEKGPSVWHHIGKALLKVVTLGLLIKLAIVLF